MASVKENVGRGSKFVQWAISGLRWSKENSWGPAKAERGELLVE